MKKLEWNDFKVGMFIEWKDIVCQKGAYGMVTSVADNSISILSYSSLKINKIQIEWWESGTYVEHYPVYNTDKLKQYLEIRKEVLTDLLDEINTKHNKEIVDISSYISQLDTCIKDLKS